MKALLLFLPFIFQTIWALGQQHSLENSLDQWFAQSKEQIHRNEKQMKFEENLHIFNEGHQKGYFYFLHPALPRYKPYLEFPVFEDLVKADRQLYELTLEKSTTLYQIDLPHNFSPSGSYPLFVIFHGGNSNFQRVRKHWKSEYLDKHFIKVYLQSYRHFDSESFTWRSGDQRADSDLSGIYEEILNSYPIDTSLVVVAGISAGANYAMGMALRGIIPVCGFLTFCPGLPQALRTDTLSHALRSDIRGYILGGEHDFYLEDQGRLTEIFDQMGLEYHYVIEEDMSHQYPEDEGKYIHEGLQFIMKN